MSVTLEDFETYRPLLFSIAYRMMGTVSETEDILQEAYLRYQAGAPASVESPKAYLTTVVTRLCLDHLKSAKVQRESYFGNWLPEPLVTQALDDRASLDARLTTLDSISMAFLVLLESLTPVERAIFLLREVFEYPYPEIAGIVGKSEVACRQIFHRARQHIHERRPRFASSPQERRRLTESFIQACTTGDLDGLIGVLAEDITVWSDGGGKAFAALRPIQGRERVARFLLGIVRTAKGELSTEIVEINGAPGILARLDGVVASVLLPEVEAGQIRRLRIVVNPDKLRHLQGDAGRPLGQVR